MPSEKTRAIACLATAQVLALALWFTSAAVLPEMAAEAGIAPSALAPLATAVQLGFAAGALALAVLGLADRFDPRTVFALSALTAAAANLALAVVPVGGTEAILLRALTGAALAGVYPVGMKIAVGWGARDRAFLVGLLVGALTLGSAAPHLVALGGEGVAGLGWRWVILATSLLAAAGGGLVLLAGLGPHHARAARFDPGAIRLAWTEPRIRAAILAYMAHMWELYAFWAWVGAMAATGLGPGGGEAAKAVAFAAIAAGGLACLPAGWLADRIGRARVALLCLTASGAAGAVAAGVFGGPPGLLIAALVLWGIAVIPDSALYSTLVADAAPPDRAGSLMTLQTALGFALTALSVQILPGIADSAGWPVALMTLVLGPVAGAVALRPLLRRERITGPFSAK
ncbi:MAG: MFS transporter [Paracoccaceae bacterium]